MWCGVGTGRTRSPLDRGGRGDGVGLAGEDGEGRGRGMWETGRGKDQQRRGRRKRVNEREAQWGKAIAGGSLARRLATWRGRYGISAGPEGWMVGGGFVSDPGASVQNGRPVGV
jgi:hypothetical protein